MGREGGGAKSLEGITYVYNVADPRRRNSLGICREKLSGGRARFGKKVAAQLNQPGDPIQFRLQKRGRREV